VFSGNILETMNRSVWDNWNISGHLDAFYTPYLGTAVVRVLDASTHQPVPNATAVVVYGSSSHVTRKISDFNGSFSFGGWVGRARPVPHTATVFARGYKTLTKATVAVRARSSTSTVLYLTAERPPSTHHTISAARLHGSTREFISLKADDVVQLPVLEIPGAELQSQIDQAVVAGEPTDVIVKPGKYIFTGESLRIYAAHSLRILGQGTASLWFTCGFGVHIANSSNVTISGLEQDYIWPCFAQGVVLNTSTAEHATGTTGWVAAKFDLVHFANPGNRTLFPWVVGVVPFAADQPPPTNHISVKATFFDKSTTRMIAHGNHLVKNCTCVGDICRITFTGAISPAGSVQPGDLATVHYRLGLANPSTLEPVKTGERGGLTYLVVNSSHVLTVDYTLHGGGTEAIVETGGNGPNTFRRVRVTRRPVNSLAGYGPVRLLASNADGFHSSCVVHGPTLEDSEFAFTGDDLLNIHSRIDIVLQVLSATAAYIIDAEGVSAPGDYDVSTLMLERTQVGDTLAFFKLQSLAPIATRTVMHLNRVFDDAVLQQAKDAYFEINRYTRIGHDFGQRVWLVNFSEPLDLLTKFDLIDVPRLPFRNNKASVRRNHMHDAYMRFGLYDSPGIVIESNIFERGFPLNVGESGDGWLEGPPIVDDVLLINNTFVDCASREEPIVIHNRTTHNVTLVHNHCRKAGKPQPCVPEGAA
jgi:hypothetical protein